MSLKKTITFIGVLLLGYASIAQSPRLIIDSKGHTGLVNKLIFTEGGRKLISVGNDKTIRVWDVNTGLLLRSFYVNQSDGYFGRIYSAAITPDEKTLAIGGFFGKNTKDSVAIGSIYLISLEKPDEIKILKGHTNIVTDLIITPDLKLVSTSADKTIKIWSLKDQPRLISTFSKHKAPVNRLTYSALSKRIASADVMGNVLIWTLETGDIVSDKVGKFHEGAIISITYSADDAFLFTGDESGKLIKWTNAGRFVEKLEDGGSPINAVLSIKGRNELLYLNTKGKIRDIGTGAELLEFKGHNNTVSAVAMAPFSKFAGQPGVYVATAGGDEKEILIWNTNDGSIVRKFAGQGHGIFAAGQSFNSQSIAFGQSNPTDLLEDAPLEKVFNLGTFGLKDVTKEDKLSRFDREYLSSKIYKESTYELNYGTGALRVDPYKDGEIRSYTFLNDHNTIAIGSTFGIPVFSRTGELSGRLIGHDGEVWSVSPFGEDLLLSSSSDQTVRIWNYKTKELLLSYFPANDREWVLWSPGGYYHASAGGEKYIGWLVDKKENQLAEFHAVSEFREKFHKPDLIKAILQEKSLVNAAKKLNIVLPSQEEIVKMLPPKITWTSPSSFTFNSNTPEVTLQASIDSNNPLKNVKLMVNGRPFAKLEELGSEKTATGIKVTYKLDLSKVSFQSRGLEVVAASEVEEIQKEEVTVQLFVENEVSSILTEAITISYQPEVKRDSPKENPSTTVTVATNLPNLYMVSIGVSNFKNTNYNLNYADDDAEAITAVFKEQKAKLFSNVYNFSLLNENATRAKILTTFDKVKTLVTSKDVVVIFIATHGMNHQNQFYIVPHDGDASNPKISCVDWRDFADVIGNLPSQVLLLIDACHSGQLGTNMGQNRSDNTEAVREIASSEYGVVIMAAATGAEYSLEHADWAHGAFTLSLIEGLEKRKADIRPDGTIYLRELDFYVSERVKDLTQDQQHPTTQKPSTISMMPVIKYK